MEREVAESKSYVTKKPVKIWNVNADDIVVSKLIEIKANAKYLFGIKFDKAITPLVLIMPKISR